MTRREAKVSDSRPAILHRWPVLAWGAPSWAKGATAGTIQRSRAPAESAPVTAARDGARWVVGVRGEPVEFRANGNAYPSRFGDWFLELQKPKDPEPEPEDDE